MNNLSKLSVVSRDLYKKVANRADKVSQKIISAKDNSAIFDIKSFLKEPLLVKVELIRRGLEIIGCGEQKMTSEHYQKMLKTAENKDSGKKIELPNKYYAVRENNKLKLAKKEKKTNRLKEKIKIKIGRKVKFENFTAQAQVLKYSAFNLENYKKTKSPNEEAFDFDKLEFPLWLRLRRTGDKFKPFGSSSVKNVGKFLTSQKVAASIRKKLLVVCDSENIIWLWPVRTGDKAKINGKTKEIIKISVAEG